MPAADRDPDLAEALELRDELLIACRDVLLLVGTKDAAALVAHIDHLLDLDDEASPGSQRAWRGAPAALIRAAGRAVPAPRRRRGS